MAKHRHLNEPVDVIHNLLETAVDGIIGIIIPHGDPDFNPAGFSSYIKNHNETANQEYLDLRGPFTDNFKTIVTVNGKQQGEHLEANIFYIGKETAIEDKLKAYLDTKEGTSMEKAAGMFKDVFWKYPVYMFGKQYIGIVEPHLHLELQEDEEDRQALMDRQDGSVTEVNIDDL